MQIAFWSNYHGQAGTTINTITTALNLTSKYNVKGLLAHTQYIQSNMESAFFTDDNSLKDIDVGIDAIERAARSRCLNKENFNSYTYSLNNRLDFMLGSSKSKYELFEKINDTVMDIFYYANKIYDFVFIDLNAGLQNEITQRVLKESDIVVVNLPQNEKVISDFFMKDNLKLDEIIKGKNKIINIGNYDDESKCSIKYIKKVYKCKSPIFCTPYMTSLKDANNNHKLLEYFIYNKKSKENFFVELDKFSDYLMEINNMDKNLLNNPIRKQSIIDKYFKQNLKGKEVL